LITTGLTTEDAAAVVGVSTPVARRWFHHAGGMPPISLDEPTGRYLSFDEREEIALLKVQDHGVREIARRIGRDPSTISRELRRNAATRAGQWVYRAGVAQWKAQQAGKRPKPAKLATPTAAGLRRAQARGSGHRRRRETVAVRTCRGPVGGTDVVRTDGGCGLEP
jgi:IS30 family transposase